MSQTWKPQWTCNNCKAQVHNSKNNCPDCGKGWWFSPSKAASGKQNAWGSRGRSHSRQKKWTSGRWEPDATGAGAQEEKADSETHLSEEEEPENTEEITPEECLKHISELEIVLASCRGVPDCKALAREVAVKLKHKRTLLEKLTRKPSEARLRSLLDRKHDRKHKLDSLDKQIAAYETNLATAKEQHDVFTKDLDAIQIEVANVMKVLNISLEQAERIPETNQPQEPSQEPPLVGPSAQDDEQAQEQPVHRSLSPDKRKAERIAPQGEGADQGMRGVPSPNPGTPITRPPTALLMAPPEPAPSGGQKTENSHGTQGPQTPHNKGDASQQTRGKKQKQEPQDQEMDSAIAVYITADNPQTDGES